MPENIILELGDLRVEGGGAQAGVGEKGSLRTDWNSPIKVEVFNPYHVSLISYVEQPDQRPIEETDAQ